MSFHKSLKMLYKWNNMPLITQECFFFFAHVIWILLKWKPLWKYSKNIIILNMFHPCWIPSFDLNLFAESVWWWLNLFLFFLISSFPFFFLLKGSLLATTKISFFWLGSLFFLVVFYTCLLNKNNGKVYTLSNNKWLKHTTKTTYFIGCVPVNPLLLYFPAPHSSTLILPNLSIYLNQTENCCII